MLKANLANTDLQLYITQSAAKIRQETDRNFETAPRTANIFSRKTLQYTRAQ